MHPASITSWRSVIDALTERGWFVMLVDDPTEWWALEQLTLSRHEQTGVLTLLTDPYHGDPNQPAWAIGMSSIPPVDRVQAGSTLLTLGRGWQKRLPSFLNTLDRLGTSPHLSSEPT